MTAWHASRIEPRQAPRTRRLTVGVSTVAIILAEFTLPTSARAADVAGAKQTIARANFESVDGCIVMALELLVVEERESVPPGRPVTGARIEAGIEKFNQCTEQFESSAFVIEALTDEEFTSTSSSGRRA